MENVKIGFELARVTVVNDLYDVILNKFVTPAGRVLVLNEKYSGIQSRDIDPTINKTSWPSRRLTRIIR